MSAPAVLTSCRGAWTLTHRMNYRFQFGVVWENFPALLEGAWLTFQLGVFAFAGGALIGLLGAALKTYAPMAGAVPGRCLCRLHHQHARADPDLLPVFRPARSRRALVERGLPADRPDAERRRLSYADPARGLPVGPADRDRGGPDPWHVTDPAGPLHHRAAYRQVHLSRAWPTSSSSCWSWARRSAR